MQHKTPAHWCRSQYTLSLRKLLGCINSAWKGDTTCTYLPIECGGSAQSCLHRQCAAIQQCMQQAAQETCRHPHCSASDLWDGVAIQSKAQSQVSEALTLTPPFHSHCRQHHQLCVSHRVGQLPCAVAVEAVDQRDAKGLHVVEAGRGAAGARMFETGAGHLPWLSLEGSTICLPVLSLGNATFTH